MSFAEAYFDETETADSRPIFAIAGTIFRKEEAIRQAKEWSSLLEKWGLPAFHMTDCALGQGHFKALSPTERDLAAREAIGIIRGTVAAYVYVTVEIEVLTVEAKVLRRFSPYEWCAISIPPLVANWCLRNTDIESVHYFFEAGAKGQSKAGFRIAEMLEDEERRDVCKFAGLSFVKKECSSAVQAADIIAWHTGKDAKRSFAGEPMRKDLAALLEGIPAYGGHWSPKLLNHMEEGAIATAKEIGLPLDMLPDMFRLR